MRDKKGHNGVTMTESGKLELDRTKEGVKKYWDYGSKFYDTAPGNGGVEESQMWRELLSGAIGPSHKNILDVGSGTGIIAMFASEDRIDLISRVLFILTFDLLCEFFPGISCFKFAFNNKTLHLGHHSCCNFLRNRWINITLRTRGLPRFSQVRGL